MEKAQIFDSVRTELAAALATQGEFNATSLARSIGRDGTYLRDFLKGKKESIGAVEIAAIEDRLKISLTASASASVPRRASPPLREVELAPDAPAFDQIGGRRDVPEYGIAVGGDAGDFSLNGEVVGYVTRPNSLLRRHVFAVRVRGSSMHPAFREGDVLYVEEHQEPRIGDDGIFEMKPTDEWEAGHAFVKELVSKGMGTVTVKQWNPEKEFSYRRDQIKRMYRVVPRNELLSV